jgi:chemotaxis protein MotA
MLLILGYLIVIGAILGGYLGAGGHVGVLLQPFEVLIIVGAALGAFVGGNSFDTVKASLSQGTSTLKSSRYSKAFYMELLIFFNKLSQKIRKEGFLSLEGIVDDPKNSQVFTPTILADHHLTEFICDNLRLIFSGVSAHQLDEIMDQKIETHHEESYVPIKAIQRVADGMPAFGIVAAVMGVVHTMESVDLPPPELGKLIAAALVGTFLGILLAYGFVGPVAAILEERQESSRNVYECTKKGLLCCVEGIVPAMTVEYIRIMIHSTMRPGFSELETQLKSAQD